MSYWVFNQEQLDLAIDEYAQKLLADGKDQVDVRLLRVELQVFLTSDSAIKAGMIQEVNQS